MSLPKFKSCGVLLFRQKGGEIEFLLLRHRRRYDLPKGHILRGESERDCALRELREETSITKEDLELDPDFRFEHIYYPRYGRLGGQTVEKTLVVFLGGLRRERMIRPSEHIGFAWIPWNPPQKLQEGSIDPLLAEVASYLQGRVGKWPWEGQGE